MIDNAALQLAAEIDRIPSFELYGRVSAVLGMLVECAGLQGVLAIGARCDVVARGGRRVPCEVVGFRGGQALLMPFGALDGVGLGCRVIHGEAEPAIYPHPSWLGRVVNAFGIPIDGKGPLRQGAVGYQLRAKPPAAHTRRRVAGGAATDTIGPILDLVPASLHERVPLVFGAAREVARIARYHVEPAAIAERAPLFGRRGLFRV